MVGEDYLGIKIFRFYFHCKNCAAEISMKTDPKNSDYAMEQGATRNYEPWRDKDKVRMGCACRYTIGSPGVALESVASLLRRHACCDASQAARQKCTACVFESHAHMASQDSGAVEG